MQPKLVRPKPSLFVPNAVAKRATEAKKVAPLPERKRFIKTRAGLYEKAEWNGSNESKIVPTGDYILVLTDLAAATSLGGIDYTPAQMEMTTQAASTGILVEVGAGAFVWNADRSRPFAGKKPEPGQRIHFFQYAGESAEGEDGKTYRLLEDKCLCGLRSE